MAQGRAARRSGPVAAGVLALLLALAGLAAGEEIRLTFIGVALDNETRQADRELQDYLYRRAGVSLVPEELEYELVVERLAAWQEADGFYLARTTPYVHVAAEMLGARLETLATYVSTITGRRTYNAYLVVSRRAFPSEPSLDDVVRFLADHPDRAGFVYHSQFSTSSFFLPSLFFRSRKIYHMPARTESLVAIAAHQTGDGSSSRLVEMVARGEADLAAVWDGTKQKFAAGSAGGATGGQVWFVALPDPLPNDLLVCSATLPEEVKGRLREAIRAMRPDEISAGDFQTWHEIREATDARLALAGLRWLARERPAPVTVEVALQPGALAPEAASRLLEALRQAVRFSASELVLYDPDFHEHVDFTWSCRLTHDGALELASSIPGSGVPDQVFQLSFRDPEDLTRRVVALITGRLHRIRYLWLYSGRPPVVIRDLDLSLPAGAEVKVQRVSWLDPERNDFRAGPMFPARIVASSFHTYQLDETDFPPAADGLDFDPLCNVAYRVVLLRLDRERALFRALTVAFVLLLLAAAVLAVAAGVRRPPPPAGPPRSSRPSRPSSETGLPTQRT